MLKRFTLAVTLFVASFAAYAQDLTPPKRNCASIDAILEQLAEVRATHQVLRGDAMVPFVELYKKQPGDPLTNPNPDFVIVAFVDGKNFAAIFYGKNTEVCDPFIMPLGMARQLMAGA